MKRKHKYKLVADALDWSTMRGSNDFEKQVNSYLTAFLITRYDVPDDECITYAKKFHAKAKVNKLTVKYVEEVLSEAFTVPGYTDVFNTLIPKVAQGVMAIYYIHKVQYDKGSSKS